MNVPAAIPASEPHLGSLVAGFLLLVAGLALLTLRRQRNPMQSHEGTRRALSYVLVYGLCVASFARVIGTALLGTERSPWLLALADVIFVTLGLFAWVMVLAEGQSLGEYGLRAVARGRLWIPMLMGIGAVAFYAHEPYLALFEDRVALNPDIVVFALLFAGFGSALPEELLFRGYLMGSLNGRATRWARVALPAIAFTAVRAVRFAPWTGLGPTDWMFYIFGVALPLGLLWGLMRELSGGSLWPSLLSHFLLELGPALAGTSPAYS